MKYDGHDYDLPFFRPITYYKSGHAPLQQMFLSSCFCEKEVKRDLAGNPALYSKIVFQIEFRVSYILSLSLGGWKRHPSTLWNMTCCCLSFFLPFFLLANETLSYDFNSLLFALLLILELLCSVRSSILSRRS